MIILLVALTRVILVSYYFSTLSFFNPIFIYYLDYNADMMSTYIAKSMPTYVYMHSLSNCFHWIKSEHVALLWYSMYDTVTIYKRINNISSRLSPPIRVLSRMSYDRYILVCVHEYTVRVVHVVV